MASSSREDRDEESARPSQKEAKAFPHRNHIPSVDTAEVSPPHQVLALTPFVLQILTKLLSVGSSIVLSRCFGLPSEILAIALFYLPTLQSTGLFILHAAVRRTAFRIPSPTRRRSEPEVLTFGKDEDSQPVGRSPDTRSQTGRNGGGTFASPAHLCCSSSAHDRTAPGKSDRRSAAVRHGGKDEEGKEDTAVSGAQPPELKAVQRVEGDSESSESLLGHHPPPQSLHVSCRKERCSYQRHLSPSSSSSSASSSPPSFTFVESPSADSSYCGEENVSSSASSLNLSYVGFLFSSVVVVLLGILWLSVHPTFHAEAQTTPGVFLSSSLSSPTTDGALQEEVIENYASLWSYRVAVLLFVLATLIEASAEPLLVSLLFPSLSRVPHDDSSSLSCPCKRNSFSTEEDRELQEQLPRKKERVFSAGDDSLVEQEPRGDCCSPSGSRGVAPESEGEGQEIIRTRELRGSPHPSRLSDRGRKASTRVDLQSSPALEFSSERTPRSPRKTENEEEDADEATRAPEQKASQQILSRGAVEENGEDDKEEGAGSWRLTMERRESLEQIDKKGKKRERELKEKIFHVGLLGGVAFEVPETAEDGSSPKEKRRGVSRETERAQGNRRHHFDATQRASRCRAIADAAAVSARLLCLLTVITLQHLLKRSFVLPPDYEAEEEKEMLRASPSEGEEEESHGKEAPFCFQQAHPSSSSVSSSLSFCGGFDGATEDASLGACRVGGDVDAVRSPCFSAVSAARHFEPEDIGILSAGRWGVLGAVARLLSVQPLLAFGIAQVVSSLVWLCVLARAASSHHGEEEEEGREEGELRILSPSLRSLQRHPHHAPQHGENKSADAEERADEDEPRREESSLAYVWRFHRMSLQRLRDGMRRSRVSMLTREDEKKAKGEEYRRTPQTTGPSSSCPTRHTTSSAPFPEIFSSILSLLFSSRSGQSSYSRRHAESSSSVRQQAASKDVFLSQPLSAHPPHVNHRPEVRRDALETEPRPSNRTSFLSSPSPVDYPPQAEKKDGEVCLGLYDSFLQSVFTRFLAKVTLLEKCLLVEEHRRLLRVNLGVMAQRFAAIEGEKFVLLGLLGSKAAGEYVFVSSAASIVCRLLYAPIEGEAFNAFCSTRENTGEEEEEDGERRLSTPFAGGNANLQGGHTASVETQSPEEVSLGGGANHGDTSSDGGRHVQGSVPVQGKTTATEFFTVTSSGAVLKREEEEGEEKDEGRRKAVRDDAERKSQPGNGSGVRRGVGREDTWDDGGCLHPAGRELLCHERGAQNVGFEIRHRRPTGEGRGSLTRLEPGGFELVGSRVGASIASADLCDCLDKSGTRGILQEADGNQTAGDAEEGASLQPGSDSLSRDAEKAPCGLHAIKAEGLLPSSPLRSMGTGGSGASTTSIPGMLDTLSSRHRGERVSSGWSDLSGLSRSRSHLVWVQSLPVLRLLLLIDGTIGLLAATQGPVFARAALRIVYGPRWGNEPGAVAALQVYSVYLLFLGINGLLDSHALATASPALLRTLQWLRGWALALHLFLSLPAATHLFPHYQAAGVVGAQCLLTVANSLISLIPLAYAIIAVDPQQHRRRSSYRRGHSSFCVIAGFELANPNDTRTESQDYRRAETDEVEKTEGTQANFTNKGPKKDMQSVIPETSSSNPARPCPTETDAPEHSVFALSAPLIDSYPPEGRRYEEKPTMFGTKTSLQILCFGLRDVLSLLTPPKPFTLLLVVVFWCIVSTAAVGWVRAGISQAPSITVSRGNSVQTKSEEHSFAFEQVSKHQCLLDRTDDVQTSVWSGGTCKRAGRRGLLGRLTNGGSGARKQRVGDERTPTYASGTDRGAAEGVIELGRYRLKDWQAEGLVGACVGAGLLLTIWKPFLTNVLLIQGGLDIVKLPFLAGNLSNRPTPHRASP